MEVLVSSLLRGRTGRKRLLDYSTVRGGGGCGKGRWNCFLSQQVEVVGQAWPGTRLIWDPTQLG